MVVAVKALEQEPMPNDRVRCDGELSLEVAEAEALRVDQACRP